MTTKISRRKLIQTTSAASVAAGVAAMSPAAINAATMPGPRFEGKDTPKLCLAVGDGGPLPQGTPEETAATGARRLRQLGVEHAITGMGRIPWAEETLPGLLDRHKKNGITIGNIIISGF